MFASSYQIVNGRTGAQLGLPPDGEPGRHDLSDLGIRVFDVPEEHRALGSGLDAGRYLPSLEPLGAEGAFLHHALGPARVFLVLEFRLERLRRAWIDPVEAPRTVGAGGHAEAAP